jgi:Protein of unknown function (DUF3024)
MAFKDEERLFHEKTIEAFLGKSRPPEKIRSELDLGCRLSGQSVEVFELRPFWRDSSRIIESGVAKATFVRTQDRWKVFWLRQDLKWHSYEPVPYVNSLFTFFRLVEDDEYHCFFG